MELIGTFSKKKAKTEIDQMAMNLVRESGSIEEFIWRALDHQLELKMTRFKDPGAPDMLMVEITKSRFGRSDESKSVIGLPTKQIKKPVGYTPLNETVHSFADREGYLVDDQWWDKRNNRLRIRPDKWKPEIMMAPPASLRELVLSYLYSTVGIVTIRGEIIHIQPGVRDAARLELVSLRNLEKEGPFLRELLHIRLDRLSSLIEKRKNKGPSS